MPESFPLDWPAGVPRTPAGERKRAAFSRRVDEVNKYTGNRWKVKKRLTVHDALTRLDAEVRAYTRAGHTWRIVPEDVVVSSNVKVRLDGLPRSGQRAPDDPGVAVYFALDGEARCIPCDRWDSVADNLAGIAGALDALRSLERWVNDAHVRAAFTGFAALPAPGGSEHWSDVLQVAPDASIEEIKAAYRRKAWMAHPDRGGGTASMARVNRARDEARSAVQGWGDAPRTEAME